MRNDLHRKTPRVDSTLIDLIQLDARYYWGVHVQFSGAITMYGPNSFTLSIIAST